VKELYVEVVRVTELSISACALMFCKAGAIPIKRRYRSQKSIPESRLSLVLQQDKTPMAGAPVLYGTPWQSSAMRGWLNNWDRVQSLQLLSSVVACFLPFALHVTSFLRRTNKLTHNWAGKGGTCLGRHLFFGQAVHAEGCAETNSRQTLVGVTMQRMQRPPNDCKALGTHHMPSKPAINPPKVVLV
jgi:hypothetical protein